MNLCAGLGRDVLRDILQWDVEAWTQALLFWERHVPDVRGARVLEFGASGGGLSLYFALAGARVVCSDRNGPGRNAIELHRRYGVADRVSYCALDAVQIAVPSNSFDIVCFKSIPGGIAAHKTYTYEHQRWAVAEMSRVLKPGGKLVFAENMKASILHALVRRYLRRAIWRSKK